MPFKFIKLEIPDLILIEPEKFEDNRGYFLEIYKRSDFSKNGIDYSFVQTNCSISKKNVLRGLHFQNFPKQQGKLVNVVKGKVLDIAVDIRKKSRTYKKWICVELSLENKHSLFIPPGFAHGFLVLSNEAILQYKCTNEYDKDLDMGIRWDDPDLKINWPVKNPILSKKDSLLPYLKDIEKNII